MSCGHGGCCAHPEESENIWGCNERLWLWVRLILEPDTAPVVVGPPIDGRVKGFLRQDWCQLRSTPSKGAAKGGGWC